MYQKWMKRPLDIILSLLAIIILSPVIGVVALLVKTKLGSPILFKQERPGLHEKIFTMYKFRTMADIRNENGELLPDSIRLTRFGKLLRSTSLDELPELFNILKGDMSIVGPRPLRKEYLPLYTPEQRKRHDVRPGLSGLAQINGRNAITWERRFEYDIMYVNNITFMKDMMIIFKTVWKAFVKREGISSQTSVTMERFMGTQEKVNV